MPAKMSGALSQYQLQQMTSGESMSVSRKGLTALNVTWSAPLVMASNHMPDYVDTGNNIGRRIVVFRFNKPVRSPAESLLKRICATELPNVACRFVTAYHALGARIADADCSFWDAVPSLILEWQGTLAAATSKLHRFLGMEDEQRTYTDASQRSHFYKIEHVPGCITFVGDFQYAFETVMRTKLAAVDPAVLARFGFSFTDKREQTCKSCKQLARSGCCDAYHKENRTLKTVIHDMRMSLVD
jgi:hypothetical protein